jgi:hypothetical protein
VEKERREDERGELGSLVSKNLSMGAYTMVSIEC